MSTNNPSIIAQFRQEQALLEESARLSRSGLAITASHAAITARMQRGAERILRLIEDGQHEEALSLLNTDDWCAVGDEGQQQAQPTEVEVVEEEKK
ncbi:MAG TPA: hypothetical protein VFA41_20880 [Ktedonobacteraceae bacterium]|jgi:hypothetical protein|nr:hypothetical protein [Ktedonobacteraceae bacterium]